MRGSPVVDGDAFGKIEGIVESGSSPLRSRDATSMMQFERLSRLFQSPLYCVWGLPKTEDSNDDNTRPVNSVKDSVFEPPYQ